MVTTLYSLNERVAKGFYSAEEEEAGRTGVWEERRGRRGKIEEKQEWKWKTLRKEER